MAFFLANYQTAATFVGRGLVRLATLSYQQYIPSNVMSPCPPARVLRTAEADRDTLREATSVTDATKARAELAAYFRSKAGFRSDIAEQKCRDGSSSRLKNELYAERLNQVATYVETLPDDHPILRKAAGLDTGLPDDLHTYTIHCDFKTSEVAHWLESWVNDAIEVAKKANKCCDSSNGSEPEWWE
jgi:hypothetical protein